MTYSSLQINNRTFKGISNLTIVDNSDNTVYVFPKPVGFVIDSGVEQRAVTGKNQLGENTFLYSYDVSKMPSLQISYQVNQPEMNSFARGYTFEDGLFPVKVPLNLQVPADGVVPAADLGFLRYGIAKDATSFAGYVGTNTGGYRSLQLTSVDYDTFNAATDDTFAVGLNGELVFSDNLKKEVVNIEIDSEVQGTSISNNLIGDVRISATLVSSINTISYVQVPTAIINTEGVQLSDNGEQMTLNFRLSTYDKCNAYTLIDTPQQVSC